MQHEEIDIQLWEYIDGTCSPQESQRIAMLIATDARWKELYNELLSFHKQVAATPPIEVAKGFSEKVMNSLPPAAVGTAKKSYLNSWVIKGIAAFFIVSIAGLLFTTASEIDWSFNSNVSDNAVITAIKSMQFTIKPSGNEIYLLSFFVAVLCLVFADMVVRHRRLLHR